MADKNTVTIQFKEAGSEILVEKFTEYKLSEDKFEWYFKSYGQSYNIKALQKVFICTEKNNISINF